jgi:hypothetical protein
MFDGTASAANLLNTVDVNQQQAPSDFMADGVSWEDLGYVTMTDTTLTVQLFTDANGFVIADAVRVEYISPLLAAGGSIDPVADVTAVTTDDVDALMDAAIDRWALAGVSEADLERLSNVTADVVDLPSDMLGGATGSGILIDVNAAGYGWHTDSAITVSGTAVEPGRMDLLTVIQHELGHMLGFEDLDADEHADDLMFGTLESGARHLADGSGAEWESLLDELAGEVGGDREDVDQIFAELDDDELWG